MSQRPKGVREGPQSFEFHKVLGRLVDAGSVLIQLRCITVLVVEKLPVWYRYEKL